MQFSSVVGPLLLLIAMVMAERKADAMALIPVNEAFELMGNTNGGSMEKRRSRELLGKRSAATYGRQSRSRELFGKRSTEPAIDQEDNAGMLLVAGFPSEFGPSSRQALIQRLLRRQREAEEFTEPESLDEPTVMRKRRNRELLGKRSAPFEEEDSQQFSALLSLLNTRPRRARSGELFG